MTLCWCIASSCLFSAELSSSNACTVFWNLSIIAIVMVILVKNLH